MLRNIFFSIVAYFITLLQCYAQEPPAKFPIQKVLEDIITKKETHVNMIFWFASDSIAIEYPNRNYSYWCRGMLSSPQKLTVILVKNTVNLVDTIPNIHINYTIIDDNDQKCHTVPIDIALEYGYQDTYVMNYWIESHLFNRFHFVIEKIEIKDNQHVTVHWAQMACNITGKFTYQFIDGKYVYVEGYSGQY